LFVTQIDKCVEYTNKAIAIGTVSDILAASILLNEKMEKLDRVEREEWE
jgi:hypothetical protein